MADKKAILVNAKGMKLAGPEKPWTNSTRRPPCFPTRTRPAWRTRPRRAWRREMRASGYCLHAGKIRPGSR